MLWNYVHMCISARSAIYLILNWYGMSYHDPVVKLLEQTAQLSDQDPRDERWDTITSAGVANQFVMEYQ